MQLAVLGLYTLPQGVVLTGTVGRYVNVLHRTKRISKLVCENRISGDGTKPSQSKPIWKTQKRHRIVAQLLSSRLCLMLCGSDDDATARIAMFATEMCRLLGMHDSCVQQVSASSAKASAITTDIMWGPNRFHALSDKRTKHIIGHRDRTC